MINLGSLGLQGRDAVEAPAAARPRRGGAKLGADDCGWQLAPLFNTRDQSYQTHSNYYLHIKQKKKRLKKLVGNE